METTPPKVVGIFEAYQHLTPEMLGFPKFLASSCPVLKPNPVCYPWCRYMKTNIPGVDYYFIVRNVTTIRSFIENGGDPSKVIVHHLAHDVGVINPLEDPAYMEEWCAQLREWGIDKVVAPDFSAWGTSPYCLQIWNYRRSVCASIEYAARGMKVIPLPTVTALPLAHIARSCWPAGHPYLVDLQHVATVDEKIGWEHVMRTERKTFEALRPPYVFLWTGSKRYVERWRTEVGIPFVWVRTEMWLRSRIIKSVNDAGKNPEKENKKRILAEAKALLDKKKQDEQAAKNAEKERKKKERSDKKAAKDDANAAKRDSK